jgi:nitrogen fixation protein NifB
MEKSDCQKNQYGHPCFDADAHCSVGRIHLPIAPACNIKCKYCSRKHDCANENRPGVTTKIINPDEALERVRLAIILEPRIRVVGIAGPGDPLANAATLETLKMVRAEFPQMSLCLSTNGLLLPEYLDDLVNIDLDSLTVTVNAIDEKVGAQIYSFVLYHGVTQYGEDAACRLRDNQLEGIALAVKAGIRVKVNSVLIPGINETEMVPLAQTMKQLNVSVMNIMPLIPQADFAHLMPVPQHLHQEIREQCAPFINQVFHCKQCRADACGLLDDTKKDLKEICKKSVTIP